MNIYFDKTWNERQSQLPRLFPTADAKNIVMCLAGDVAQPAIMVRDDLVDRSLNTHTILYPLYFYEKAEGRVVAEEGSELVNLGGVAYEKKSAISPWALNIFRRHYADEKITREDIFYYAFAIYNHRDFLKRFKNSLAKASARLPLSPDFKKLVKLGKKLAHLQINYESGPLFPTSLIGAEAGHEDDDEFFRVDEMKIMNLGRLISYNKNISIEGIPERAYNFKINGKSAINWVVEFYKLRPKNKIAAQIPNDPNAWAGGRYVYELLLRVIQLGLNCDELMKEIAKCEWGEQ